MRTWRNDLNKIVDKQKKKTLHETGSSAVTNIALEREKEKKTKERKKITDIALENKEQKQIGMKMRIQS